jgi:hypothetical protein
MEQRAPSVKERRTNLSSELPRNLTTRAYSLVAANAAIHEAWIQTSRASCGSDFGSLVSVNKNGGYSMPLYQLRTYIERTRQKRKALHMLALSGVVRPGHVELRYATPFPNVEDQSYAFPKKPATAVRPSSLVQKLLELMSWPTKDERSFWKHLHSYTQLRLRKNVSTSTRSSPQTLSQNYFSRSGIDAKGTGNGRAGSVRTAAVVPSLPQIFVCVKEPACPTPTLHVHP